MMRTIGKILLHCLLIPVLIPVMTLYFLAKRS